MVYNVTKSISSSQWETFADECDMASALESLRKLRQLLEGIDVGQPIKTEQIRSALRLLKAVEDELAGQEEPPERRRGAGVRYIREEISGVELLTEIRETGSKPFRAGYDIFSAVVKVLAAAPKPLAYDDVAAGVSQHVQPEPGSHQIRMILRFLLRKGLIARARNRYGRAGTGTGTRLTQDAMKSWQAASIG